MSGSGSQSIFENDVSRNDRCDCERQPINVGNDDENDVSGNDVAVANQY